MNPDGSIDANTLSYYETSNGNTVVLDSVDGSGGTAAVKITSHCTDFTFQAKTVIGGSENAIDVNNETKTVTVNCDQYVITGKYGLSAKTSHGTIFTGHLSGRASKWEINLGSWSDQSDKPQTDTFLDLTADTYPIRVWVGNADIPLLADPSKYQVFGFGTHGKFVRAVVMFFWKIGKKLGIPV